MAAKTRTRALSKRPAAAGKSTVRAKAHTHSHHGRAPYDAGSHARRTAAWRPSTSSPNTSMLASLETMRSRSRDAVRNDGYAKGIIDKLVSNVIGTGITPLSQAEDPTFREAVQKLWLRWTDESDADGVLDFYGQQTQAVRCWFEGGESFARLRPRLASDGLSVPLQLQLIEPELCPHTYSVPYGSPNRIKAGVEFDPIGRRVAYWFHPSRTNDRDEIDSGTLKRIPGELVSQLYDPLRAGQVRGLPLLAPVLLRLHELDVFDDAALRRQQVSNLFAGFVTREAPDSGSDAVDPITGESLTDGELSPLLPLEGGLLQELEAGEDIKFSNPPDVGQMYPDFMRQQLIGAAAGAGVPYEVITGDLSKVNDRTVRVILQEFRRRIQAWQHQVVVYQFCRFVWNAFIDRIFLSGVLAIPASYVENPEPWQRVLWRPQGWPYLNPLQDLQANKGLVRAGLSSRTAIVSDQGEDAADIDAQNAEDNARADKLGLVYDSDARKVSVAGLTQARPAGSDIPDTGEPPNDGGTE